MNNTIAFPQPDSSVCPSEGLTDRDIADRINHAVMEAQEAMDAALLAGLLVEPSFTLIDNRLTKTGVRIDSHVCKVNVFRKLA